jgi:hypothetical protein
MGNKKDSAISRREFARYAALISAGASLTTPALLGTGLAASTDPGQQPPSPPRLSPEGQTEAESRLQAILSEYGSRFSEGQKADLRRLCTEAQPVLDRLRAYPTENGDDPALYLKPLMEREKKPSPMTVAPKPAAVPRKS